MHGILPEIGIAILAATALGFIFQLCRQPVILGYLVAGALIDKIEETAPDLLKKNTGD